MNSANELFALQIKGGAFDGHYIVRHTGDGFFDTTTDINLAHKQAEGVIDSNASRFYRNAQYCYCNGAKFVKVKAN